MNNRSRIIGTTLAVGVFAAGALLWSNRGAGPTEAVPARPQLAAIQITVATLEEPLPRIQVPPLEPRTAPAPRREETGRVVPPRPRVAVAVTGVPAYREELPQIAVPELRPPLG